ncbi:unnamed protein product, partial [Prorocentrum cordatum]
MGDFGWSIPPKAPAAEGAWASDLRVSPCALAISTTANACLSQTDVWGAPVPLGAAVFAVGVSFLLGILALHAVQATICTCLVSVRVILWGFTNSEVRALKLKPGDGMFFDYGEAGEHWHERLILAALGGVRYILLTPDEGMYEEEIDIPRVVDFEQAGPRGGLPAGLGAAKGHPVYRFTEKPKGTALQAWFDAAEAQAAELRDERGLTRAGDEPEPAGEPAPPLPDRAAPPGGERDDWCCVVAECDAKLGKVYSLPDSLETPSEDFAALGRYGLYDLGRRGSSAVMVRLAPGETASEAQRAFAAEQAPAALVGGALTPPAPPEDARALAIRRDAAGRRFRDFKSVAEAADNIEFEDWVLSGPRAALHVVTEIAKQSGGPVQRRATWKHENKPNDEEHSVVANEMLSDILELACTYDQMDVSSLASMGALARHMQFIEHKIEKEKETVKDFDPRDYYLGRTRRTGGAIVSPELLKWVAESAARDLDILEEERKAAERGARGPGRDRSAQRIGRRSAVGRRVNDCIAALNNLRGEGDFCSRARPSEAQFSAVDMLWQVVSEDKPPGDAASPEAALVELLGSGSLGYGPDGPAVVAPYDRGLVSRPESAGRVGLEPDRQGVIDGENSLMLRADEARPGAFKVCWDKTLQSNRDECVQFVEDLLGCGVVELRTHLDFEVGVFFVRKKSGRLRIIVDARAVNQALRRPPTIHMASTAAVVGMEVEGGAQVEFSIQDIADCFYQFRVPDYMLGVKEVGGHALADGAWVYPCLRVLSMGFSWATRWAQQAHRELLHRGGLGGTEGELVDRQIAPSVDSLQVPRIVYVDNEICVSSRAGAAKGARGQAAAVASEVGMPLREVEESAAIVEALGLELGGIKLRARLARAKRWRLAVIGHFTHAMLLNRPALCVMRSAYDFARKRCRAPVPFWPSVRQELADALHLLPLLTVHFDVPSPER